MSETAPKILLVEGNKRFADLICSAFTCDSPFSTHDIFVVARADEAFLPGESVDFDLVLVGVDIGNTGSIEAIERLRVRLPGIPVVVVAPEKDLELTARALEAGACDCLGGAETNAPVLQRVARHAIERGRMQRRIDELQHHKDRETEMSHLGTLCGPAELRATRKSLDARQLMDARPKEFSAEIERYASVLDRLLAATSAEEREAVNEEVHGLADRLGGLNTGPRDLVEIHKAAIAHRLIGPFATDTAASIEEGRLLLLQLMGHLVSYYRRLSWGRRHPSIARQTSSKHKDLKRREKE